MTENSMQKLNPQVSEANIGKRHLRTINIYPLSVGDQMEMSEVIAGALEQFLEVGKETNLELMNFLAEMIKVNLKKVLELVIDEEEDVNAILKECTNEQALNVINIIIEKNYGDNLKNAKSLFEKVSPLFLVTMDSETSSPQSVNDMVTDLKKSSDPSEEAA